MTGFGVDPGALRAAADAAKQASGVVSKLELGRVAELTGTESARTAGELGPALRQRTTSWSRAASVAPSPTKVTSTREGDLAVLAVS
jgi:hypothetical protein